MGDVLCSVIIPVTPKHRDIVSEAIESAAAQTIPCEIVVEYDDTGQGAAATRNAAIRRSSGLFVVPLDADDLLKPDFVETCLKAYAPGRYVYTHWIEDGKPDEVPPCETWNPARTYHFITTLIPRVMFDMIGGFDVNMPALEDCDFFQHARSLGWYGTLAPVYGWEYRRRLGTSNTNPNAATDLQLAMALKAGEQIIKERYARYWKMGCCGNASTRGNTMQKIEGDVEAFFLSEKKGIEGKVTKRYYTNPRTRTPIWVDPRDAQASPQHWQLIPDVSGVSPDLDTVQRLVQTALNKVAHTTSRIEMTEFNSNPNRPPKDREQVPEPPKASQPTPKPTHKPPQKRTRAQRKGA